MILRLAPPVALALMLAACGDDGVVKDDIKPTPELNDIVEPIADWSNIIPAIGQTPNESAVLTKGPLPTDLGALLGPDWAVYHDRLVGAGGKLEQVGGGVLMTATPAGPEAAYLVVYPPDHAIEAGWRTAGGWEVRRTPGADFPNPPQVEALKAAS